jgi:hypothetical protein
MTGVGWTGVFNVFCFLCEKKKLGVSGCCVSSSIIESPFRAKNFLQEGLLCVTVSD